MIVYETIQEQNFKIASFFNKIDVCVKASDVSEFVTIMCGESWNLVPDNILKMQKCVSPKSNVWPLLITTAAREQIIHDLAEKYDVIFQNKENLQYFYVWHAIRIFLNSLIPAKINTHDWKKQIASSGLAPAAKSLSISWVNRADDMIIKPIQYSMKNSSTGRLTVTDGPNFLTLPRQCRKALRPKNKNSQIVSIDFTSLEPRVALQLFGNMHEKGDIYEFLMEACEIKSRDVAKLATISALYGASSSRLVQTLGNRKRAQSVVSSVRNFFGVARLEEKLEIQANEVGVRNIFGRPLREATRQKRVRLNHVIQSSSADLANLLFSTLCSKCPFIKPLVVIHDALIVEVPNAKRQEFDQECSMLSYNGYSFPTKIEVLHN